MTQDRHVVLAILCVACAVSAWQPKEEDLCLAGEPCTGTGLARLMQQSAAITVQSLPVGASRQAHVHALSERPDPNSTSLATSLIKKATRRRFPLANVSQKLSLSSNTLFEELRSYYLFDPRGSPSLAYYNSSVGPLKDKNYWNKSHSWVSFPHWHPAGVESNVHEGTVLWADVDFISVVALMKLSMLAYPFFLIPMSLCAAVAVGLCLRKDEDSNEEVVGIPAASVSELIGMSPLIYRAWHMFCCALPSLIVFGVPVMLVCCSYALPQEVSAIMLIMSSAFVFSNGIHMALYSTLELWKLIENNRKTAVDVLGDVRADQKHELVHWVILPNFNEDVGILEATLRSIAQSSLARMSINVVLAMEEREGEAVEQKSMHLKNVFVGQFREFLITIHPAGLANDPPGKASNVSWAFKHLNQHLNASICVATSHHNESRLDFSKVMITIADADTEFHEIYFETITRQHLETDVKRRSLTIWQSAILHTKNYHRLPGPLVVGTMFSSMTELAVLADPHGIRFPYSTYTIPFQLADRVGGWDPEWISEDWHMGIKCFLLTLGRSEVKPVNLPTINYSPETETWIGTCYARFVQAKRHALGFGDLSYYFMMLPLVFLHLSSVKRKDGATCTDFWRLFFNGVVYIYRLVNTHAVLSLVSLYAVLQFMLNASMRFFLSESRGIKDFLDRTFFATYMFGVASIITVTAVTINFQLLYRSFRERFEPPRLDRSQWLFTYSIFHWIMTFFSFVFWGPLFFLLLAYSDCLAAFKLLFMRRFEYEVAAKPNYRQRAP